MWGTLKFGVPEFCSCDPPPPPRLAQCVAVVGRGAREPQVNVPQLSLGAWKGVLEELNFAN